MWDERKIKSERVRSEEKSTQPTSRSCWSGIPFLRRCGDCKIGVGPGLIAVRITEKKFKIMLRTVRGRGKAVRFPICALSLLSCLLPARSHKARADLIVKKKYPHSISDGQRKAGKVIEFRKAKCECWKIGLKESWLQRPQKK